MRLKKFNEGWFPKKDEGESKEVSKDELLEYEIKLVDKLIKYVNDNDIQMDKESRHYVFGDLRIDRNMIRGKGVDYNGKYYLISGKVQKGSFNYKLLKYESKDMLSEFIKEKEFELEKMGKSDIDKNNINKIKKFLNEN